MGLKKVRSDGNAYMFTDSSSTSQNTLTITIVEKDNSFTVKVSKVTLHFHIILYIFTGNCMIMMLIIFALRPDEPYITLLMHIHR